MTTTAMHSTPLVLVHDRQTDADHVIKVRGDSDVLAVARYILIAFSERSDVVVRALGVEAVNQAVKAVAIARGHVAERGLDLTCRPGIINFYRSSKGSNGDSLSGVVLRLHLA